MAEEPQVGDIVVHVYSEKCGYVVAIDPQHNITMLTGRPRPVAKVVLFGENATQTPIPFYFHELKKIG